MPSTRFILRDFTYSPTAIQKATEDFAVAETTERELWTELLRISRTNFSEAFQVLVHLKVARLFVESVLRYGLPAQYIGIVVKVSQLSRQADCTHSADCHAPAGLVRYSRMRNILRRLSRC